MLVKREYNMSSKGSRSTRQLKRAEKFNRGLVTKEDLKSVIGMSREELKNYVASKNLRIREFAKDRYNKKYFIGDDKEGCGPDALNVNFENDKVKAAKTNRRFINEMKTYNVMVREVHYSHRTVRAASEQMAKDLAGDAEETYLEYSDTCDKNTWMIEEVKEK